MEINLSDKNSLLVWKLCDEVHLNEAILLMCGILPEGENLDLINNYNHGDWPKGTRPLGTFLKTALANQQLEGRVVDIDDEYYDYNKRSIESINVLKSTIKVHSLTKLLIERGVRDSFFNDGHSQEKAEYLDDTNPYFAPKLAAAVRAWKITTLDEFRDKRTPKQNAEKWLRENAAAYGLNIEDTGLPNESAIAEIAKIVNWKPQGGATKTPSTTVKTPPANDTGIVIPKIDLSTPLKTSANSQKEPAFDDDIPF
jgi:hypothetical protein